MERIARMVDEIMNGIFHLIMSFLTGIFDGETSIY